MQGFSICQGAFLFCPETKMDVFFIYQKIKTIRVSHLD
jgi:hypothetical protein